MVNFCISPTYLGYLSPAYFLKIVISNSQPYLIREIHLLPVKIHSQHKLFINTYTIKTSQDPKHLKSLRKTYPPTGTVLNKWYLFITSISHFCFTEHTLVTVSISVSTISRTTFFNLSPHMITSKCWTYIRRDKIIIDYKEWQQNGHQILFSKSALLFPTPTGLRKDLIFCG